MGLPALDKVLYGIQRRYIYTIGADTSGGKTSFGLDIFVYNLIKMLEIKRLIFYIILLKWQKYYMQNYYLGIFGMNIVL